MNRRLLFLSSLTLLTSLAQAQGAATLSGIETASKKALSWFRSLSASIDELVIAEKRSRLLDALSELSKSIYALEQDKVVFLRLLKRQDFDRAAIESRGNALLIHIAETRNRLLQVGTLLREKYQAGGVEVEHALSTAISQKSWVGELLEGPGNVERRVRAIQEGEKALVALREANTELSKLIARL